MNKLHRQLVVLCIQHEEEWTKAFKEGKLVVGVSNGSGDFRVIISWYNDDWSRQQIVVQKFDDEASAIQVMKKAKQFIYNKLGEWHYET